MPGSGNPAAPPHGCWEPKLTSALELRKAGQGGMSLSYLFSPLWAAARSVARQIPALGGRKQSYECHADAGKAQKIADNLVQDWLIAQRLVDSYGGKFVGAGMQFAVCEAAG